ncbi:MAG: aminotransferase class III-fold pyridoxal phosphate-dependent enzyme [Prochlorococcus marinus XMU1425]|nr:aminotransferase class III-fold pyridoxal phosphate-dependent enzyme [Prochlorococcus marinus XMU1425]MCR8534176.1 aminotransferase class III-fold pyridoxal phosphate-dependent enzyme [Prochlorococcus marinus XMU1426]
MDNLSGQNLWQKAKSIIPGGNMLLSKRSEMFLPNHWPAYYSKAKGCEIWDLDGKKYIDMSIMGIGTNILGYGNEEVDETVVSTVLKGNMSTFNCPEEVYLAEKLIDIHSWAEMVKFARTGGEANAVAVRIARAATNKDKIAICGYHGWHDWYLASNLKDDDSLKDHLLPGLEPHGVPKELKDSILTFEYNNIKKLEEIISNNDLAAVKMEVERSIKPKNNFLQKVRDLCTKNNVILIFDECTSGFRETIGGLHLKYSVQPDLAIFGKALGNGYAITAVIGKKDFMDAAQKTFISSTFWTERIGPSAAIKTLEIMNRIKSWEIITKKGQIITEGWKKLSKKHNLEISINGINALPVFSIQSKNMFYYKTYITQEMLKKGYLASNLVYLSVAHKIEYIEEYLYHLDTIFGEIREFENGKDVKEALDGPVCHQGFKRLN